MIRNRHIIADDTVEMYVFGMDCQIKCDFINSILKKYNQQPIQFDENIQDLLAKEQIYTVIIPSFHGKYKLNMHYISEQFIYDKHDDFLAKVAVFVISDVVEGSFQSIIDSIPALNLNFCNRKIMIDMSDSHCENEKAVKFCSKKNISYLLFDKTKDDIMDIIGEVCSKSRFHRRFL